MQLSPYAIPGIMHTIKPGNHKNEIERIINTAAVWFGITADVLKTPRRFREISIKRQLVMHYLASKHYTLSQIGKSFNKDHSTVIHARNTINTLISIYPDIAAQQKELHRYLTLN